MKKIVNSPKRALAGDTRRLAQIQRGCAVAFVCAANVCSLPQAAAQQAQIRAQIVGGSIVSNPQQEGIQYFGVMQSPIGDCSGVLIGQQYFLTNAHCLFDDEDDYQQPPLNSFSFLLKPTGANVYAETVKGVKTIHYLNPLWQIDPAFMDRYGFFDDVALLELAKPSVHKGLTLQQFHADDILLNSKVTVYAAGQTTRARLTQAPNVSSSGQASYPLPLQKLTLTRIDAKEHAFCRKYIDVLEENIRSNACYQSAANTGLRHGDSGGPVVYKTGNQYKVVGLQSMSDGDHTSIYMKSDRFYNWLKPLITF